MSTQIPSKAIRGKSRAAAAFPFTILFGVLAAAQAADLSVRVSDPTKAAIPSATVAVTSQDGERRIIAVGPDGAGRFASLAAGKYFVQAEAPGFDASRPQSIELSAEDLKEVDVLLGVAQV